jgi:tripartite-type tricarboxylate transporter receptor subunit TctC
LKRLLAAFLLLASLGALAQEPYASKPIRMILPFPPGGGTDLLGRLIADRLAASLGQPVVTENRGGAGGNVGAEAAARSAPDGYTIVLVAPSLAISPTLYAKLNYDPIKDFAPIALVAQVPNVMITHPSVPATTLAEFIAYARANPGKLNYGTPSVGTVNHLLIERLKQTSGIDITNVPFRGSPEAMLALLKNDIQLFPIGLSVGMGQLREGKVTALAVAAPRRLKMLPGVPTMAEAGFPGFTASNWWGMAAPAGTPDNITDTLYQAVAEALRTTPVEARFLEMGMVAPEIGRQQFAASLQAEAALWSETIARGNIKIE